MRKTLRSILTICATTMLLFSTFVSVGFVKANESDDRIFIQPDGGVVPAGAPIKAEGDTYTLTKDVDTSIVIEKSDITLDGGGHSLLGTFNGTMTSLWMIGSGPPPAGTGGSLVSWTIGIDVAASDIGNLTITNIKVENFSIGMYIWTQNNTVTDNTVKGNIVGILIAASQNSFTGNFIENNTDGMFVGVSSPYNPYSDIAIHNNYFINNTQQINGCHCLGTLNETNPWGINVDGNYWSDYNGTEKNSNGTGVIPYLVNGKIPDNHPLMNLPSAQLSETSKNSDIELLLAVILAVIVTVTLITLRKRKQKTSKGIKQTRSN